MKRIVVGLFLALCITCLAQTNTNSTPVLSGPLVDLFNFASTGSNWMASTYGIISTDNENGAGVALSYRVGQYVAPTMRIDELGGKLYLPSASLQLQAPVTLFGKVTAVPFGFAGGAVPLSGSGNQNGSMIAIMGIGAAIRLDFIGSGAFWQRTDLVMDVERWTGFQGQQFRIGALVKF